MLWDMILVFVVVFGIVTLLWGLVGLLYKPVFSEEMITYLPVSGDAEKLEQQVRGYAWFREGRVSGSVLVLIDRGLSDVGKRSVEIICRKYDWVQLSCN